MPRGPKPYRATTWADGSPIEDGVFINDMDSVDTGVEDMSDEEFQKELEDIGVENLLPENKDKPKPKPKPKP